MPSLRDFVGQELKWVHPYMFQNIYELRAGEQCLATLSRSGVLKRVTLAETDGQQWRFKREGNWKVSLVIYSGANEESEESRKPLASIRRNSRGQGELMFSDGHTYTWSQTRTGFWRRTWSWAGPEGTVLSMKKRRLLEVASTASDLPDLPLLVLFSLYLILIKEEEEATSAGG
jgi:hypothetical protein